MNTISITLSQNIIDYIEQHLLELLSPNAIAKQFFISVSTLNNLFKIVCNMTIMEYVRNRRISLAGKELRHSNIRIIDLAYKYGYETPEAFSKAFTRCYGFPPSFVRRAYPLLKSFEPLFIRFELDGGWKESELFPKTKEHSRGQESRLSSCYDETIKNKGGLKSMKNTKNELLINTKNLKQKKDWNTLLSLAKSLTQAEILFKVDGKTMIFVHGLEFKLDKICLTFKWNEEQIIKDFFHHTKESASSFQGFKFFDTLFEGMKIRCMFYGDCEGDDRDEFLFKNTEILNVDGQQIISQTLEFFYENNEPDDEYYPMVEQYLKKI